MGTCYSGEEEAKATELVAPSQQNPPINVLLKKQGLVDMDYDVIDLESNSTWMLIDTVGGLFTKEMKYYIKHRMEDQEESTNLGTGVIRNSDVDFDYHITKAKAKVDWDSDADVFSEDSAGDNAFDEFDGDVKLTRKFTAKWKFAKEIHIYADKDMEQPIGNCKVKCKGKYKRKTTKEIDFFQVEDTDDEGNVVGSHQEERVQYKVKHKNKLKQFVYKMNIMGEKYDLGVEAVGGSFGRAKLIWRCQGPDGSPVFEVHGDGHNARLQTFGTQNVVMCILLGFAVGCKFDPQEVQQQADGGCHGIPDPNGSGW